MEPFLGKKVIIDAGKANGGIVILRAIYGDHYCKVSDGSTEWDTMLCRLTKYNPNGITT